MKLTFNNYWTLAALPLAALCAGACSTDAGAPADDDEQRDDPREGEAAATSSSSSGAADAGACAAEASDACGTCMQTACCTALTECADDADCTACVTAEDSAACERTAATHARVDAFLTCRGGEACAATCVGATGGSCAGLLDDLVAPDCQACLEASCCEEVASCHGEAVCWDGCFTNHDETKCHGAPDGHALFHALGECASKQCATLCN